MTVLIRKTVRLSDGRDRVAVTASSASASGISEAMVPVSLGDREHLSGPSILLRCLLSNEEPQGTEQSTLQGGPYVLAL